MPRRPALKTRKAAQERALASACVKLAIAARQVVNEGAAHANLKRLENAVDQYDRERRKLDEILIEEEQRKK